MEPSPPTCLPSITVVKKQTPTALSGIETLEGAIKAYGSIVTKVGTSPQGHRSGQEVDGVVEGVSSVYTKYTNGENIKAFKDGEEYLKQIECSSRISRPRASRDPW